MAHALLAWELGANLGHLAALRLLASELLAQGHQVSLALRDLDAVETLFEPGRFAIFQAPIKLGRVRNPVAHQYSYASLLHSCGFDDAAPLAARLRAWRTLMAGLRCDCVYVEHAPTALLAARTLGLPRVHFGSGFTVPPMLGPFPPYRDSPGSEPRILAHNEREVLKVVNAAMAHLRLQGLERLQDIFSGASSLVASYPELDHYRVERPEIRIGLPDAAYGLAPVWPQPGAPRLFAYLRPSESLPRILDVLKQSRAQVLLRIGDVPASQLAPYTRPGMIIVEHAVHLREAAASCDAFVNYGAHGTVAEMLLAGKPGLLLPDNTERSLVAGRAEELGAALIGTDATPPELTGLLTRLIEDPLLRAAAMDFASSHRNEDRAAIIARIAAAGDQTTGSTACA